MSPPDPIALTRTKDVGLNAARQLLPGADPAVVGFVAELLDRGVLTVEELRAKVMRAKAALSNNEF